MTVVAMSKLLAFVIFVSDIHVYCYWCAEN